MRLEKIKLAGFKSFVDPTTVSFPSPRVGVVGPNGCGKSNVIDAVRWVMGESSAKMLRGESMADVIFNGSTGRKPVGTASIELVFDNAEGRAGGEFARFNQISVKRQVSRDGQSAYFLNGTRCRRRDIQDLFLGTGLGPRSYSIIEQGMISRIIEARPEDLRLFLEEAAGISKYKERRRETETRMRHTRDNLERLDDLREEIGKQLQHLERQAATAEKYTALKAEERQLDQELKALRWRALDQAIAAQNRDLGALQTEAEARLAEQRRLEAEIEAARAARAEAAERFGQVQERFYAIGAEISRAEEAIRFAGESRVRTEAELARLDQEQRDALGQLEQDRLRLGELGEALARDEPELEDAEQALEEASARLREEEQRLRSLEAERERFGREAAAPGEQAQVERARLNALEQSLAREQERLRRVAEERERLAEQDLGESIERLEARAEALEARRHDFEQRQERAEVRLNATEQELRALTAELDGVRTESQQARGRLASLHALQEERLADGEDARRDWLARAELESAPRLFECLEVEPGWEQALEVALGDALDAVIGAELDRHGALATEMPPGLVLLEPTTEPRPVASEDATHRPPADGLAARVRAPEAAARLLAGARASEGLDAALAARAALGAGERWVTREGFTVGPNWLAAPPARSGDGVLARAEAIRALEQAVDELEAREEQLLSREEAERVARTEAEDERASVARALAELGREQAALGAELTGLRAREEHRRERLQALAEEARELEERMAEALDEMEERRERLHELLAEVDILAERREALDEEREGLRERLERARAAERDCRARAERLRLAVEANRAARTASAETLTRAEGRETQLRARREELLDALETSLEPLAEQRERLEEQLALRLDIEAQLGAARARLEALETALGERERERHERERQWREAQGAADGLRLQRQEQLVRRRTLEEQLAEAHASPQRLLEGLDPAAEEGVWQERLARVGTRIQRLGAINLAAIDEYREQAERKQYLDAQHEDISRSLETLESAIRKIDRETRARFKETFEQVNQGFQQLFPRLFGGGQAYLELTGEDLLETGVSVMARPPGKRNSSIHLLSGGEKALTAVALVFAIFELNPAPFCMLDEVDAPLDDANVGRFCTLVREMSERVQFIFISHNKVTMEIADHLIGVTMHEPGVSRLVSVDVEEAVRLAAV